MAVTIVRSVWIDDDGTGTTGTVINQAVHTALYNEIDGALAKVAQLAGGNTFTGNQNVSGSIVTITGAAIGKLLINTGNPLNGQFSIAADGAVNNAISISNLNPANSCYYVTCYNSTGGVAGAIRQTGATSVSYDTTSDARLKRDAGPATDLTALRGVVIHDFTWIADGQRSRGVFAQEAATVFPRAIGAGTDEVTEAGSLVRPWMTDYSQFVPDLIVGWQQHDAALAELRALLATVTG
jgi:hypothetical protein